MNHRAFRWKNTSVLMLCFCAAPVIGYSRGTDAARGCYDTSAQASNGVPAGSNGERDAGSGAVFRLGFESIGENLDSRGSVAGFYEWRSPEALSLILEYRAWRHHFGSKSGDQNEYRLVSFSIMDVGVK